MSDEQLVELSCATMGCTNWAEEGFAYCGDCLHQPPRKLTPELAARKLRIEKERSA